MIVIMMIYKDASCGILHDNGGGVWNDSFVGLSWRTCVLET